MKINQRELASFLGKNLLDEYSRSELGILLLNKIGYDKVSESMIDTIFQECDADNSGRVSLLELASYLQTIEDESDCIKAARLRYVLATVAISVTWWAIIVFVGGSTTNIALNVCARVGYPGCTDAFNLSGFSAICWTFGCIAFLSLDWEAASDEVTLVAQANQRIMLFALSQTDKPALDTDQELTPREMYQVLEQHGVYLPFGTFQQVFGQIDQDGGGTLSMDEIRAYATAVDGNETSPWGFKLKVFQRCSRM